MIPNYSLRKIHSIPFDKNKTDIYAVRRIDLWPMVRIVSVLFSIVGLIVGLLAFLIFPSPSAVGLSFSTRFFSSLLFAILYTVIITFGAALIIFLYNLLASRLKWEITFHLYSNNSDGE